MAGPKRCWAISAPSPIRPSAIEIQNRQFSALGAGADYLLPTLTQNYAGFLFTETAGWATRLHLQASGRIEAIQVDGTPVSAASRPRATLRRSAARWARCGSSPTRSSWA